MEDVYGYDDLLDRLTSGLKSLSKQVVFLIGSAATAPIKVDVLGVPNVSGIIELILGEFDADQRQELRKQFYAKPSPYQEAFHYLLGRRGPQVANGIIRKAVAKARVISSQFREEKYSISSETSDEVCRAFDSDKYGWSLSPAV